MKAKDAANVAGNMKKRGCVFAATAEKPSIGRIIVVVAVLEVSSVKKVITRQIPSTTDHKGQLSIPVSLLPIQISSPVPPKPLAKANPPPNKSKIPQGIFSSTVFQSRAKNSCLPFKFWPFSPLTGKIISNNPIAMATVESCRYSELAKSPDQPGSIYSPNKMG